MARQAQLRLKEGVLILLAVLCIYLWMVLLTFDVNDPGFTQSVSQQDTVNNAGGQIGAWIADVLFSVLGYFAWLFPLVLMLKTVLVFHNRYQPMVWNGWLFALRAFGFILLLCSGAALAHVHFPLPEITPKNFNILGETLGQALTAVLNIEGATLLLLACFLFGLTVYANFSWFKVMEGVGALTLQAIEAVKSLVQRIWDNAQARQHAKIKLREVDEQVSQVTGSLRVDKDEQVRVRERILKRDEALAQHVSAREGRSEPVIAAPSVTQAAPAPSKRVQKEKQAPLFVDSAIEGTLPPLALLDKVEKKSQDYFEESLQAMSRLLEIKLKEFGVEVQVESVHPGPVVTRFEIQLAPGVKVSRITNLAKDLARSLAMISVRVVEVIPGKTTVGIEIPNEDSANCTFLRSARND